MVRESRSSVCSMSLPHALLRGFTGLKMGALALCAAGCGAAPDVASEDVGTEQQAHTTHWVTTPGGAGVAVGGAPVATIGTTITGSSPYAACASDVLWDAYPGDAGLMGTRTYLSTGPSWPRCQNWQTTLDGQNFVRYSGANTNTRDGLFTTAGTPYTVRSRYDELVAAVPWWGQNRGAADVAGYRGCFWGNTASQTHLGPSQCGQTFHLTWDLEQPASGTSTAITVSLDEANFISDRTACESGDARAMLWILADVYVYELNQNNDFRTRMVGSRVKQVGVWSGGKCTVAVSFGFSNASITSNSGTWHPIYYKVVAGAGVGHVPSVARFVIKNTRS
jgi:hypothetical protein